MLSLNVMIVLCAVGSCGLRLEEKGGQLKLETNEKLEKTKGSKLEKKKESILEKVKGSILDKVTEAVKNEVFGVELARRGEKFREIGDGKEVLGDGGGDGKDKEVVVRGDERRKKKKRNCRGKTRGTFFKVSCNLLAVYYKDIIRYYYQDISKDFIGT